MLYDKREQLEQKFFAVVVKDLSDLIFYNKPAPLAFDTVIAMVYFNITTQT